MPKLVAFALVGASLWGATLAGTSAERSGPEGDAMGVHAQAKSHTLRACTLEPGPVRTVVQILDAQTLQLDDGSQVVLAGMVSPSSFDAGAVGAAWPPETQAVAALQSLLIAQTVSLGLVTRSPDRYGRLQAHVFLKRGDEWEWVQGLLLAQGYGRVVASPEGAACEAEALAMEAPARVQGLGLWANAAYQVRQASRPFEVLSLRDSLQIVAGTVQGVSQSRSATYLRFGPERGRDFSVAIKPTVVRALSERGIEAAALTGTQIRVRGMIVRQGEAPMLELDAAAFLEIVDDAAGGEAPKP